MIREISGLNAKSDELKKLIKEHPDYDICVLVGEECALYGWHWTYASDISFGIEEILTCHYPFEGEDSAVPTDKDIFYENLEEWLWDKMCDEISCNGMYDDREPTEKQFQKELQKEKAKYEPYWKKCICIYADN